MLYIKSTLIVIAGLVVAMMYNFKVARANEISVIDVSFYIMVFMLTFFALKGIVNGERLRNESFKRIQSENNLLKSQLNPHFLYNTLNNIDALIWISPEKASDSILKLSHIMRYMTYKTKLSLVPINDEVNYLSEYVELQKLRYNNDKVIDFKVNVEDKSKSIAPMLLIPFVENAFKHSTNVDSDGAIKINIDSNSRKLSFRIENPADKSVIEKRKEDMLKKISFLSRVEDWC
jgi:Putative regulator of cell autolysis